MSSLCRRVDGGWWSAQQLTTASLANNRTPSLKLMIEFELLVIACFFDFQKHSVFSRWEVYKSPQTENQRKQSQCELQWNLRARWVKLVRVGDGGDLSSMRMTGLNLPYGSSLVTMSAPCLLRLPSLIHTDIGDVNFILSNKHNFTYLDVWITVKIN